MRDSTLMVFKRGMECLLKPMADNITGNGNKAIRMVKESILGLTGDNMRDNSLTIKKRDMEYLLRPMVLSTMETGVKDASTVLEFIVQKMERSRKVNGIMAVIYDGRS